MATSRTIITPMFRVSYANVWQPRKSEDGTKDVWSVAAIFEPAENMIEKEKKKFSDMALLAKEVKEAKWAEARNGGHIQGFKQPFRRGVPLFDKAKYEALLKEGKSEEEAEQMAKNPLGYDLTKNPEYAGKIIASFRSYGRPIGVAGPDGKLLLDHAKFYSGCYAIAEVSCYAYDTKGNKGVSFGLKNLRKVKDGEPLIGANDPESAFSEIDITDYGVDNSAMFDQGNDLIGGI